MNGGLNYFKRENNDPWQYKQFYNQPYHPQGFQQQLSPHIYTSNQTPFEQLKKPSQPYQWPQSVGQNQMLNQAPQLPNWQGQMEQQAYPNMNPHPLHQGPQEMQQHPNIYPQAQYMNRPPSIMAQFQNEDGQIDVNKMLHTVGQLANTVQQVSPVVKQLGSLFKTFI